MPTILNRLFIFIAMVVTVGLISSCGGPGLDPVITPDQLRTAELSATSTIMDPYYPGTLGLTGYKLNGVNFTGTEALIRSTWSVTKVEGHLEFPSDEAAKSDLSFVDPNVFNPTLKVATPRKWPNGSSVTLHLVLSNVNGSMTVYTPFAEADFIVNFDGWGSTTPVVLSNTSGQCESTRIFPFNIATFVVNGRTGPVSIDMSKVEYQWSVDSVNNSVGFPNAALAFQDVWLMSESVLSPVFRVRNPLRWSAGSSITFRLTINYRGVSNSTALYTVHMLGTTAPRLTLTPHTTVIPATLEGVDMGIDHFYCSVWGIDNEQPGLFYGWDIVSASGYQGFVTIQDAIADIKFDSNTYLSPYVRVGHLSSWPKGSTVTMVLRVLYQGQIGIQEFTITFDNTRSSN